MRPDGSFLLEWTAEPGATYTVRRAGADFVFQDVPGEVRALSKSATWSVPGAHAAAEQRFYRVRKTSEPE